MDDERTEKLIEKIIQSFNEKCRNHFFIQKFEKKVLAGKADLIDVDHYAGSIGSQLSQALLKNIDFNEFETGRMYLELSEEILTRTLKNNYDLINRAAAKVQKDLDARLDFMIKSQKADFPIDRIKAIARSLCDKTVSDETIRRRMSSPVENITQSFYTDYVQKNAQFRNDAGLKCYIVRETDGKCCAWCSSIAGRYVYGEHPEDIFRRHDNCGCTVIFEDGRTRQDVWTKRTWEAPDINPDPYKPTTISPEKAKKLQEKNLPETLTGGSNGGIMLSGSDNVAEIISLGKIDTQPLEAEFGKLKTNEIIVTNERLEHIKFRHPQDYELFKSHGAETVQNPDLIIKDCKNENTVFMVKKLDDTNLNVIIKLILDIDKKDYKNSVMTFYRIRESNLKKLEKKNKALYKRE